MLQLARIPRVLLRLSRVLAPALVVCVCASAADAAPQVTAKRAVRATTTRGGSARHTARLRRVMRLGQTRELCSSRLTLREFERQNASQAGPVAHRSARVRGLMPTPTRFKRGRSTNVSDSDAAIQNDTPAARFDCHDTATPALHPLGFLAGVYDRLPAPGAFSPRSPRGPPPRV